jgi:hypothetical protein
VRPFSNVGRNDPRARELGGVPEQPEPLPASNEVDISDLKDDYTSFRVLEEIGARSKLNILARCFRYPPLREPMPKPAYVRRGPALQLISELARSRQLLWGTEENWTLLTPAAWPFTRRKQIPDAALDRWLAAAEARALSVEHVRTACS